MRNLGLMIFQLDVLQFCQG